MRREAPRTIADYTPLFFPGLMLVVFFVVPFSTMIVVSFFKRDPAGFYTPDFVIDNYARFLSVFFGSVLGFSLMLAVMVAICCVAIAFPFTYLLTRCSRRVQTLWLVGLLSVLSLSEVIIGFAWSTLFSRTAGITNLFVSLGLMEEPVALLPSFWAWSIRRCPTPSSCSIQRLYVSIRPCWKLRARLAHRRCAPSSTSLRRPCVTPSWQR
jgi:putative spermidine/putrescine transport system permease protein